MSLQKLLRNWVRKMLHVLKSGRTHLQDAVPVTIGQEFGAYGSAIANAAAELRRSQENLYSVALGGTATGTGANTHPDYKRLAIAELAKLTGFPLKPAGNNFEACKATEQPKRFPADLKSWRWSLSESPTTCGCLLRVQQLGLNEITLPPVQPGSSIMPGKVNPVMAECLDMVAFQVVGNDVAVSLAVQAGQLELNVMTPAIAYNMLFSIQILSNYLPVFHEKDASRA